MRPVRHAVRSIAAVWLTCQLAVLVTAPLAFCCNRPDNAAAHEETCCPGVGPGQVCPMHHTREGARTCRMVNACSQPDAALSALASGLGILPHLRTSQLALQRLGPVMPGAPVPIVRAARPDPPPPRS